MPASNECIDWSGVRTQVSGGGLKWLTSDPGTGTLPSNRVNTSGEFWSYIKTNAGNPYSTNMVMNWSEMQTYRKLNYSNYATHTTTNYWRSAMALTSPVFFFECWIRVTLPGTGRYGIASHWDFGDGTYYGGWSLNVSSVGQVFLHTGAGGGTPFTDDHVFVWNMPNATWTHFGVSFNGGTYKLYANGVLQETATTGNSMDAVGLGNLLDLGAASDDVNPSGLTGILDLDEVRYWSTIPSDTFIAANYDVTISPSSTGLQAYYQFENNANDSTANAYNLAAPTGTNPTFITDTGF